MKSHQNLWHQQHSSFLFLLEIWVIFLKSPHTNVLQRELKLRLLERLFLALHIQQIEIFCCRKTNRRTVCFVMFCFFCIKKKSYSLFLKSIFSVLFFRLLTCTLSCPGRQCRYVAYSGVWSGRCWFARWEKWEDSLASCSWQRWPAGCWLFAYGG